MGKLRIVLPLLVIGLILSACPIKEVPQIQEAEQAIAAARAANAEKYSPTKLHAAEQALQEAQAARQKRKYNEATQKAELAKKLANEARQESLEAAAREQAPPPGEAAPPPGVEAAPNYADIFKTVYFDFDRSDIKGEFRGDLDNAAKYMKDHKDLKVTIMGHCDPRGTEEYNMALGERRAKSIMQYLVDSGVDGGSINVVSKGKMELIDPNCAADDCWAKERRGIFEVK